MYIRNKIKNFLALEASWGSVFQEAKENNLEMIGKYVNAVSEFLKKLQDSYDLYDYHIVTNKTLDMIQVYIKESPTENWIELTISSVNEEIKIVE